MISLSQFPQRTTKLHFQAPIGALVQTLNGQETQRFPLLPGRFAAVGGLEREVVAEGRHLPVHQLQHLDVELARCRRRRYPANV